MVLGIDQLGGRNETCDVKGGLAAPRVLIDLKLARKHDRRVDAVVIDAIGNCAEQRAVRVVWRVTGRPVEKCVIIPEISQPCVQRLEARKRFSNGIR